MAKKGGKDKGGKGKGKGKKNPPPPPAPPLPPPPPPPEQPKEKKIKIDEPCLFTCAQDKVTYRPNSYPGLLLQPKTMAIVGSECGSYDSLCKLIHSAFCCSDRTYIMVPWGNYVVFRAQSDQQMTYYVFDGCACNVNRFRYLDLTCGTAGLLYFEALHKVINYIILSRARREEIKSLKRCVVDDVCKEMYSASHV